MIKIYRGIEFGRTAGGVVGWILRETSNTFTLICCSGDVLDQRIVLDKQELSENNNVGVILNVDKENTFFGKEAKFEFASGRVRVEIDKGKYIIDLLESMS